MKRTTLSLLLMTAFFATTADAHQRKYPDLPPKDPGIAQPDSIIQSLIDRGLLSAQANEQQQAQALRRYMQRAHGGNVQLPPAFQQLAKSAQERSKLRKAREAAKSAGSAQAAKAESKTVKVLALLIDFPDLPNTANRLSASSTAMYYSSYPASHYQNLMFNTQGYTGPSGQTLKTAWQYYQAESGGSFFFTGKVFDWVTADKEAKAYGGNTSDDKKDQGTTDLIKEAVTKAVAKYSINLDEYDIEDPYDLDADGILTESDGIIDHVMVFHSSRGEESGGGVLGDDAIWSHRFFVNSSQGGFTIPGSNKKLFGYTIQPIDAGIGVVVHEFGHDLGLPDEYDEKQSDAGEPVSHWSVMSGGSWSGALAGSKPSGFSPFAREYLQEQHGGNWMQQRVIRFDELQGASQNLTLAEAINHDTLNQVRIDLPAPMLSFKAPYAGQWQYWSDEKDKTTARLAFASNVPAGAKLVMKAHWDLEEHYDFTRIRVNGTALAGTHTVAENPLPAQNPNSDYEQRFVGVKNYLTGKSSTLPGAEGADGWVTLEFDLATYADQNVNIEIATDTDDAAHGYGFVVDNLKIVAGDNVVWSDDAETAGVATLNGFQRIGASRPGQPQNYWLQVRNGRGNDEGLADENFDAGLVLWFGNKNYSDNNVGEHPGYGFLGVVDADQNLIKNGTAIASSDVQVRDAPFGILPQSAKSRDEHLGAIPKFDDRNSYGSQGQRESGLRLPSHGLSIEVLDQAANSSQMQVQLLASAHPLTARFDADTDATRKVKFLDRSFGNRGVLKCQWEFGDGNTGAVCDTEHTYAADNIYNVKLTVTDENGASHQVTQAVDVPGVVQALSANFTFGVSARTVNFTASSNGGRPPYTLAWDFGDGSTGTGASATHTYTSDGNYTVKLTATDARGTSITSTQTVIVKTTSTPAPGGGGGGGGGAALMLTLLAGLGLLRRRG